MKSKCSHVQVLLCLFSFVFTFLSQLPAVGAENLAAKGYLVHNFVSINEGKACNQYLPVATQPWEDNTPFSQPVMADIWFPYTQPATINSISFWAQFDVPRKGEIQAWSGTEWKTVGQLPTMSGRPAGSRTVKFEHPVITSALRILVTQIGNTDHDVLHLTAFNIQGDPPAGAKLYDPEDLTLSCASKWNVFDIGTPATVDVSIGNTAGATNRFRVVSSWTNTYDDTAGQPETTENIVIEKGATHTFRMSLKAREQGPYCANVSIYTDQRNILLAKQRILVGVRDPKIFDAGEVTPFEPATKPIVPYAQHLKECGCIWTAELCQCPSCLYRRPSDEAFHVLKHAGTDVIGAFLCYNDFEPLPGVYNFAYFDWMVKVANRNHLGLDAGLWRWEFGAPDQYWLKDEIIKLHDGSTGAGWKNLYSFWGPQYNQHAYRAVEVLVKRYINSPSVWLWYPHPFGKVDHDNAGIEDYSTFAQTAFRQFLQKRYGGIARLNAAYGCAYSQWSDVPMPDPLWRDLDERNDFVDATRVLDTRPQWEDYLTFFHEDGILRWREGLVALVRSLDPNRGFDGTDASAGVGAADQTLADVAKYGGSEGDENIESKQYIRRFIPKLQYGIPSRYEDSSPVTPGRINVDFTEHSNWDAFEACFVGANQFNYAFPTWDTSPFFDLMYSNPRAQKMVKLAAASSIVSLPIADLHSFVTDTHEGEYVLNGISAYRWWVMNGFSRAMLEPGRFFTPFSEGGDLSKLDTMQVVVDDGSRIMSQSTIDRLVRFTKSGGKLVLLAGSGERLAGEPTSTYPLLRALGYGDVSSLSTVNPGVAQLVFHQQNGVFSELGSLPVYDYRVLNTPKGGSVLGTINGLTGAVEWTVGTGSVILLAGSTGSITAATFSELAHSADPAVRKANDSTFSDAVNEQGQIVCPMMRDLMRWAGIAPLFTVDADYYACLRRQDRTNLVYLYNPGSDSAAVLRIPLPGQARYRVSFDSLTESRAIGQFTGAQLESPGISLPAIKHAQTVLVRVIPE